MKVSLFIETTGDYQWFMPMIIGVYLGMPIIAFLLNQIANTNFRPYLIILGILLIVFGTLFPTVRDLLGVIGYKIYTVNPVLELNIFGASVWGSSIWMVLVIIGFFIHQGLFEKIKISTIAIFTVCSLLLLMAQNVILVKNSAFIVNYANSLILTTCFGLFWLLRKLEGMSISLSVKNMALVQIV